MLKDTARVIFKEKPFDFTGKDGKKVTVCKYHIVIDEQVFTVHGAPDVAEVGASVPLTVRPNLKGAPLITFARPR